ncbi:hypothetical protein SAY87_000186 [Trapa incisa]|uniref:Dof zinc finger protein n=1 Tax=Trapa incisa TaxID=236973 RepID=A0AAN7GGB6_9MYRT|nr:hypothetical protein SAY87_000186 [Trapa incisa]
MPKWSMADGNQLGGFDGRWGLLEGAEANAPSCPRCASPNTKFCYYNNYSLSQPRYFCKSCRRYWTKGGSLRNVPVGGGCRKTRRSRASRAAKLAEASPPLMATTPLHSNFNSSAGPEIDLAAVFAKFLNPEHQPRIHLDQDSPSDATALLPDHAHPQPLMYMPPEAQPAGEVGEFMAGDELGLMAASMLAESAIERAMPVDELWLDAGAPPDYTWQQQEASPSNDIWRIDTSADSWSSTYDFTGFDILTRNYSRKAEN